MSRADKILKEQGLDEAASRRSVDYAIGYVYDVISDLEAGVQGENGSSDPRLTSADDVLKITKKIKKLLKDAGKLPTIWEEGWFRMIG